MNARDGKPATYADIEAAPAQLVAEINGGQLVTHPRPSPRHRATAAALAHELGGPFQKGRGGPGGWIFVVESEVRFGADILVPDIAGWRRERLQGYPENNWFDVAPDWVCEILSGSTERRDRTTKMGIDGKAGIPHLWLIDPRLQILEAFENNGGRWTKIGDWMSDDQTRAAPFDAIAFNLADLWPLDRPLGMNEDPTPYHAGDR